MFKFLLVDRDLDGLLYYGRTLRRKFAEAMLVECTRAHEAIRLVKDRELSAAVVHGAEEMNAEELIPLLRAQRPSLPIIWVSSGEPKTPPEAIGADRFINYDAWLMVGTLLAEVIDERKGLNPPRRLGALA